MFFITAPSLAFGRIHPSGGEEFPNGHYRKIRFTIYNVQQ